MQRAPALFVGHGSPMNAIEDNPFTREWARLGQTLPRPAAILAVSAHWFTGGTLVSSLPQNKTIHDMYGFPEALYRIRYDAPGAPDVAARVQTLLGQAVRPSAEWGLDHGAWSVLRRMYPAADIPVLQLSVERNLTAAQHYRLGQALAPLRNENVMVFASGNVVHNLGMVSWGMEGGLPWADTFDRYIRDAILQHDYAHAMDYRAAGSAARLAVPTMDHFAPLFYALGAAGEGENATVFNDARVMGSLSMTGYLFA